MDNTYVTIAWSLLSLIVGSVVTAWWIERHDKLHASHRAAPTYASVMESYHEAPQLAVVAQHEPQVAIRVDAPLHPESIDASDVIVFTLAPDGGLVTRVAVARSYVRRFVLMPKPTRAEWSGSTTVYSDLLKASLAYGLIVRENARDARWADGLGRIHSRVEWLKVRNVYV